MSLFAATLFLVAYGFSAAILTTGLIHGEPMQVVSGGFILFALTFALVTL